MKLKAVGVVRQEIVDALSLEDAKVALKVTEMFRARARTHGNLDFEKELGRITELIEARIKLLKVSTQ